MKCFEFCEEMEVGLLAVHRKTQHGIEVGGRWQWDIPPTDRDNQTYRMAFPNGGGLRE